MDELLEKIPEQYPFLSYIKHGENEYIGIIQNRDAYCTSFYDYNKITDLEMKKQFLDLAEVWWWESNRMIPINIFLKKDWLPFKPYLMTFSNKNCHILAGHEISLNDLAKKRTKRKSIQLQLVKKVD